MSGGTVAETLKVTLIDTDLDRELGRGSQVLADINWTSVVAIALGGILSGVAMSLVDRLTWLRRSLVAFGTFVTTAAVVYLTIYQPLVVVFSAALLMGANLLYIVVGTSGKMRTKAPTDHQRAVWIREMELLHRMGWTYLGTWVFDAGQTRPVYTVFGRDDGTRAEMLGTHSRGGHISIETSLDGGRGIFETHDRSAPSLRPAWKLRQELKGTGLADLVAGHDEALWFLRAHGITPGGDVPGDPLEFDRFFLRKLRRHVKRRWWLWMVRPIARRFQPRTKGPLHEQPEIGKQLERYSEAVASEEPILVAGPESSSHVPPHPGIR